MRDPIDRRSFLTIAGASIGVGALFEVLPRAGAAAELLREKNGEAPAPFSFVQMSDTHVGFEGPPNPLGTKAFERAVEVVNALPSPPDLVLFTGDLTHDSEKPGEPAARMKRFREIAGGLKVKNVHHVPGEHDAGLDGGVLYRSVFGESHYSFDHRGIHFVALDNVSLAKPAVGPEQVAWLTKDLARFPKTAPIVVFTHRPLFDLAPEWEWFTGDGDQVMSVLAPFEDVTVLYGHIHRQDSKVIGRSRHLAARSLIFGFPDPAAGVEKKPLAFDKEKPFGNLGVRQVKTGPKGAPLQVDEVELTIREYAGMAGITQLKKGGLLS
jgi:3',5'-cyclic AMP phosphodiesterase CpdA